MNWSVRNIRMMFLHPGFKLFRITFCKRILVQHNTFVLITGSKFVIGFGLFKSVNIFPVHFVVQLIVDIKGDILLADNYFAGPVFSVKVLAACYAKCFISVHPFEKYTAVNGYKDKECTYGFPSERYGYCIEVNPTQSSDDKNKTPNEKHRT